MLSLGQAIQVINRSTYKLSLSGVVGLFGGNNAGDALETIHLYAGRRWVGWYNYAGSATVAQRFGQIAVGRFWDSLFPGLNQSPAVTFSLAGRSGPNYIGFFSGTKLQTKYPGRLIAETCADYPSELLRPPKKDGTPGRETGSSAAVTVISLHPEQHKKVAQSLPMAGVNTTKQNHETIPVNPKRNPPLAFFAVVPSLVSILVCIFCILGEDFLCATLVLFGILSSGFSSFVLGSAKLNIRVPVPSISSPPGDGLLFPDDGSIIILKGKEADVNIITKGEFELDYSKGILPHERHHAIGVGAFLLLAQSLIQLLLVPLCTFFGQILFLISFVVSGGYHLYVVSHGRDMVHRDLFLQVLPMQKVKWTLGTRTQMAALVCLFLGDSDYKVPHEIKFDAVLSRILPNANETPVWRCWKMKVLKELDRFWEWNEEISSAYIPTIQARPEDQREADEYSDILEQDLGLLNDLIDDAWCVFNMYPKLPRSESVNVGRERCDHGENIEKVYLLSRNDPV